MKYIVVTGGTVSGLGKGITISSIGTLLKLCGLRTTSIKIDPYLNVDAGTMSPYEHGEVFVLDDGGETDLDLGNYERFLDVSLTKDHNITTGKVYKTVIDKERKGNYLGKTVQVVPHITNEIMDWLQRVAPVPVDDTGLEADVCLVEVGGTVGDIESMVFLEALRQFQFRVGRENMCFVHVSLVPTLGGDHEQKTKPTQHGVKELRSVGLSPDMIICRSSDQLQPATCHKIALFCHVAPERVLSVHDVPNVYHVPMMLRDQNITSMLHQQLKFPRFEHQELTPDLSAWAAMAQSIDTFPERVSIALVGKYTGMSDAYLSVLKALKHAATHAKRDLDLVWIESSDLEDVSPAQAAEEAATAAEATSSAGAAASSSSSSSSSSTTTSAEDSSAASTSPLEKHQAAWAKLKAVDGIIVPGGFGDRGVEGKILTAKYAREHRVPYLGVCLGMQMLVVEYARHVLGRADANSTEFNKDTKHPTVIFMPEIDAETMGGNMRLGARPTLLHPPHNAPNKEEGDARSLASLLYGGVESVSERHRHRYEVNPAMVSDLEQAGLNFIGRDDSGQRMEIAELPRSVHPFYLGVQYHPEFKSRPLAPSPPFLGLLLAASGQFNAWAQEQAHTGACSGAGGGASNGGSPKKRKTGP